MTRANDDDDGDEIGSFITFCFLSLQLRGLVLLLSTLGGLISCVNGVEKVEI